MTALLTDQLVDGGAVVNTASIAGIQWPSRLAVIHELLAIEGWDEAAAWFAATVGRSGVEPYPFTKECLQVFTMHGGAAASAAAASASTASARRPSTRSCSSTSGRR